MPSWRQRRRHVATARPGRQRAAARTYRKNNTLSKVRSQAVARRGGELATPLLAIKNNSLRASNPLFFGGVAKGGALERATRQARRWPACSMPHLAGLRSSDNPSPGVHRRPFAKGLRMCTAIFGDTPQKHPVEQAEVLDPSRKNGCRQLLCHLATPDGGSCAKSLFFRWWPQGCRHRCRPLSPRCRQSRYGPAGAFAEPAGQLDPMRPRCDDSLKGLRGCRRGVPGAGPELTGAPLSLPSCPRALGAPPFVWRGVLAPSSP